MRNSKRQEEWEDALNMMNRDELQYILEHPKGYYSGFLKMAKARFEELTSIPEHEAMKVVLRKALEELGCPCEINEDGDLDFFFQGQQFFIILSEENHYIEILDCCWKSVKLSDIDEVKRLKFAINEANSKSDVTTVYFIDEEEQFMGVYCTTSILYRPMITNLKDYLRIRLLNFFYAHDIVNAEMTLIKEKEQQPNNYNDTPS